MPTQPATPAQDDTSITVYAIDTDRSQGWLIFADGTNAAEFATRVFDTTWNGVEDESVAYQYVAIPGYHVNATGNVDHEIDLRGLRTEAEVDAKIRAFFGKKDPEQTLEQARRVAAEGECFEYDFDTTVLEVGNWEYTTHGNEWTVPVFLVNPDDPDSEDSVKAIFRVIFEEGSAVIAEVQAKLKGEEIGQRPSAPAP